MTRGNKILLGIGLVGTAVGVGGLLFFLALTFLGPGCSAREQTPANTVAVYRADGGGAPADCPDAGTVGMDALDCGHAPAAHLPQAEPQPAACCVFYAPLKRTVCWPCWPKALPGDDDLECPEGTEVTEIDSRGMVLCGKLVLEGTGGPDDAP